MVPDRWEHGSEFHRATWAAGPRRQRPWREGIALGCGRDALRAVARHGIAERGWRRLWLPSYLCQEVAAAIAVEGLALGVWPDLPGRPFSPPPASLGEAVLVVNTFGLRSGPPPAMRAGVDVIEDHTHDPTSGWAVESRADYAVASLRKTLPVAEGGVLWSPIGRSLPPQPAVTVQRARAAAAKREAMQLKARYLAGEEVPKTRFRELAVSGEAAIAAGEISGMTGETAAELAVFPIDDWREMRRRNHAVLAARLARLEWLSVLWPESDACVPFSVVVVVDSPERRERVRADLIGRRVYPAVLWPLEDAVLPLPEEELALSRRVLSFHCDARYGEADMLRVAGLVEAAGAA